MASIQVGSTAPDFSLEDQRGESVRLYDLLERASALVLYFYPKDDTPGCTAEACSFRDQFEDFTDAGATVVGISSDSVKSHSGFADRHGLPFTLLSDGNGEVRKRYGVKRTLGLLPGRVTYVIDSARTVQHTFSSQLQAAAHVEEALAVVRRLAQGRS